FNQETRYVCLQITGYGTMPLPLQESGTPVGSTNADGRQLGQRDGLLAARREDFRFAVHNDVIVLIDHLGRDAYAELRQLFEDFQAHGQGVAELHRAGELHRLAEVDSAWAG